MKNVKAIAWILLSFGIILLVYEGYQFNRLTYLVSNPIDFNDQAISITSSIGSMIGGTVGVIFSLTSVIFFVIALRNQQEESKILRLQSELQALETVVFNLFVIQNDIRKSILKNDELDEITYYGIEKPRVLSNSRNTDFTFESLFKGLKSDSKFLLNKDNNGIINYFSVYVVHKEKYNWQSPEEMLERYYLLNPIELNLNAKREVYKRFLSEFRSVIGHYFRNLYHILKYLFDKEQAEAKSNKNTKEVYLKYKRYADLLQAQMSTYELLLCFYNGLVFKRAKFLYQYYDFLENINLEELIDKEDAKLYSDSIEIDGIKANPILFKSKSEW